MINFAHDFGPEIQHVTFLLPFFIFTKFNIRQSKRLNLANTWVLAKFKRFDWRIVNCAKIKNGSKNVTYCTWCTSVGPKTKVLNALNFEINKF